VNRHGTGAHRLGWLDQPLEILDDHPVPNPDRSQLHHVTAIHVVVRGLHVHRDEIAERVSPRLGRDHLQGLEKLQATSRRISPGFEHHVFRPRFRLGP
jgi:hypothetical protein